MTDHKAKKVLLDSLVRFPGNPRRGNVEVIRESLRLNGQYRPVVVRRQTNEILAGNHTHLAAEAEGWTEIWATFIDCDDDTAKRINLVDNRAPELGGYDGEALAAMLGSLPDLTGTGWVGDDLDSLLHKLAPTESPESVSGTGDGDLPLSGLAVMLVCKDSRHQQALVKALNQLQNGVTVPVQDLLQDADIQAVRV